MLQGHFRVGVTLKGWEWNLWLERGLSRWGQIVEPEWTSPLGHMEVGDRLKGRSQATEGRDNIDSKYAGIEGHIWAAGTELGEDMTQLMGPRLKRV